jgi:hypothetical protein
MRRYKRRNYAIALLLMGVPVLLGAMPFLRDLANRVALIEQFLNGPGAPRVVVDANGETVGTVVGLDYFSDSLWYASALVHRYPTPLVQLDGSSAIVRATSESILGYVKDPVSWPAILFYEGRDCEGPAWTSGLDGGMWAPTVVAGPGRTVYSADLSAIPEVIEYNSLLFTTLSGLPRPPTGPCPGECAPSPPDSCVNFNYSYEPKLENALPMLALYDLDERFDPPFQVVGRRLGSIERPLPPRNR